jgi:cytochrome c oxidase subunit 3
MSLLDALTEKPWLAPGVAGAASARPDEAAGPWDRGIGVGLFLVVVSMIFGLVTMAYLMRMGHGAPAAPQGNDWRSLRVPPLLWINTTILVASSLAFAFADRRARRGNANAVRGGVIAGGLLGFAFLAGQLLLWRKLSDWGYVLLFTAGLCKVGDPLFTFPFPQTILGNPALAFFYLISALHGLHIIGGLVAWGLTARHIFAGAAPAMMARSVQLCARYWHFLLLVWAVMMGLFVST